VGKSRLEAFSDGVLAIIRALVPDRRIEKALRAE